MLGEEPEKDKSLYRLSYLINAYKNKKFAALQIVRTHTNKKIKNFALVCILSTVTKLNAHTNTNELSTAQLQY